jgi:hypothetical protein
MRLLPSMEKPSLNPQETEAFVAADGNQKEALKEK